MEIEVVLAILGALALTGHEGRREAMKNALAVLCARLVATSTAVVLDRSRNIDQYGHDMWSAQNGLPGEAVPFTQFSRIP
jgi:hypothetical protein